MAYTKLQISQLIIILFNLNVIYTINLFYFDK